MPRLNADITIYPISEPGEDAAETVEFRAEEYDYLSLINEGTYGIPPLVTKTEQRGEEKPPVAGAGDTVLYVNPGAILAMLVSKRDA
jgi:hypothetical protein